MKSRNIKTRLAAFGLALLMGLSPLGNLADVHAAETKNPSEPVTESVEISETEQTEEASEAAKHLVTAEDITKDISDKDFMAETCMEGIHYNSEQEDVTLERIEAEDGGSYHPDQAGTYIATYWVVPKDTFDSDLYHGKYYVKEEVRKPGYLPNEEIWEMDASYTDQNLAEIKLTKEVENQPTESQFTKTDATTGEELEGAKLQIIDKEGNIVEEWISAKEPHVVYGLPEGTYILHEELPPYAEGYIDDAGQIHMHWENGRSLALIPGEDSFHRVDGPANEVPKSEKAKKERSPQR